MPIHWGTFYPAGLRRLRPDLLTGPPHEFARLARELAPEVEVRVLAARLRDLAGEPMARPAGSARSAGASLRGLLVLWVLVALVFWAASRGAARDRPAELRRAPC